MLANNEVGTVQLLAEIGELTRSKGILFHSDAVQGVGKVPFDVEKMKIDLASITAHKMYGPKGVGALYVRQSRPAVRLEPQITGGGQQDGLRSGTLNVAGIVGFARALELCAQEMPAEPARLLALRNQLWKQLRHGVDNLQLCGPALEEAYNPSTAVRLPGNLDVAFGNVDGEALLLAMGDLAVSSGAACSSTDPGPSHVLLALGTTEDLARSTLRFGLGRFNTAEEVDIAAATVGAAVNRLRKLA